MHVRGCKLEPGERVWVKPMKEFGEVVTLESQIGQWTQTVGVRIDGETEVRIWHVDYLEPE